MARTITGATDELHFNSIISPASPCTISFKFKPTWSSGDGVWHQLFIYSLTATNHRIEILKYSDNNVYVGTFFGGGRQVVADTGLFSANTWMHVAYTLNSGTPNEAFFVNAVQKVSGSPTTLDTYDTLEIGNSTSGAAAGGDFAEFATWNAELDAAEITALSKGYSPLLVRPSNLIQYLPLIGKISPEIEIIGGKAPDSMPGATAAPHPRIIMPRGTKFKRYRPVVSSVVYVYARPDADSIDGTWMNELNTQVNLFASIDETAADDADYIISSNNPSSDIVKISLSDPGVVAMPVTVSYRYCKRGEVSLAVNLTVDLLQGVTSIASWSHTDIGTTFTTVNQTLTAPQFAAITDFNDLYLQFNASV